MAFLIAFLPELNDANDGPECQESGDCYERPEVPVGEVVKVFHWVLKFDFKGYSKPEESEGKYQGTDPRSSYILYESGFH
jgi:hypothetical protein